VSTVPKLRSPQFTFLGAGFAVGDGTLIATNAHVISKPMAAGADPQAGIGLTAPQAETIMVPLWLERAHAHDPDTEEHPR